MLSFDQSWFIFYSSYSTSQDSTFSSLKRPVNDSSFGVGLLTRQSSTNIHLLVLLFNQSKNHILAILLKQSRIQLLVLVLDQSMIHPLVFLLVQSSTIIHLLVLFLGPHFIKGFHPLINKFICLTRIQLLLLLLNQSRIHL